jgi:carboxyl-terminal processing protease
MSSLRALRSSSPVTVSRYYTPSGHAIQADGVHPDVAVEMKTEQDGMSYREKDLEGHLAAESNGRAEPPKSVVVVEGDAGAPTPPPTGSEARYVPSDPEKGSDPVLRVGWQVLRRAMGVRSP